MTLGFGGRRRWREFGLRNGKEGGEGIVCGRDLLECRKEREFVSNSIVEVTYRRGEVEVEVEVEEE